MNVLALEFSSPRRSVAAVLASRPSSFESVEQAAGHPDPFSLIEIVLRAAGLEREQIDCLAVGLGPGSYHGVRAAIALAQGWQLANGVKLLGVSSVATIAAQAQELGFTGAATVVVDAQRNEFYLAAYDLRAGECREAVPLRIATLAEAKAAEAAGAVLIGPEATRWFASGQVVFPTAGMLAKLAVNRSEFASGECLEPIYLRETTFVKSPPSRKIA